MARQHIISALSLAALGLLAACTDPPGEAEPRQGLVVHSDMPYVDDVGGFTYTVTEVDCDSGAPVPGGVSDSATIGRDALYLPNGIPAFEGKPFKSVTQGAADLDALPVVDAAYKPAADAAQVEAAAGSLAPVRDPAAYLSGAEQRAVDRASIVAGAVVGAGATAAFGAVAGTWRRLRRRQ